MRKFDLAELINEYGMINIRIARNVGDIENPVWDTFEILNFNPYHKIQLKLIDALIPEGTPDYMRPVFEMWNPYVSEIARYGPDRIRIFVLVDEDNKYERIY